MNEGVHITCLLPPTLRWMDMWSWCELALLFTTASAFVSPTFLMQLVPVHFNWRAVAATQGRLLSSSCSSVHLHDFLPLNGIFMDGCLTFLQSSFASHTASICYNIFLSSFGQESMNIEHWIKSRQTVEHFELLEAQSQPPTPVLTLMRVARAWLRSSSLWEPPRPEFASSLQQTRYSPQPLHTFVWMYQVSVLSSTVLKKWAMKRSPSFILSWQY